MRAYRWLCLGWLIWHPLSYAESFMCPTTFRMVSTGDTAEALVAACGQPEAVKIQQNVQQVPAQVTRWVYSADVFNPRSVNIFLSTLAVAIKDNRVVQIEKNGLLTKIADSALCTSEARVKEGDSMQAVLEACGPPSYIAEQQIMVEHKTEVTIYSYNFGPYRPKALFEFENNSLMRIVNGEAGS